MDVHNLIIVGGGIAGWTAAIYSARGNLHPLVFSGMAEGGQLMLTNEVENFPGFPEGILGPELVMRAKQQAERFGAKVVVKQVDKVEKGEGVFLLRSGEEAFAAKAVIIATGASARWLGVPGEEEYKGSGVTVCATCDGAFFKDKDVFVVGGGDSACEEAHFLTKFARTVTIVHRRDALRASKIMQKRVLSHPKISVMWNSVIVEVLGDGKKVTGAKIQDTKTGEVREHKIDGIFLAIGHVPNTKLVEGLCDLDEHGFLQTDRFSHTSVPGIFGAGDVQDPRFKQAITAAGSGCMAAMEAEKFLESLND
ncbi:thioredoxin-disulfide reductase [Candidatus Woesearchaeota archaeon]|nr:MAG: thioredoxin-disulfide reductase [Candidatus Woesearchaeota archaeon]